MKKPFFRITQVIRSALSLILIATLSGCFTPALWEGEGLILCENYQGKTQFDGDLANSLVNNAGEIAYPGIMRFRCEDNHHQEYSELKKGWLIIPANQMKAWNAMLAKVPSIAPRRYTDPAVKHSMPDDLDIAENPSLKDFQDLPFYVEGEGFDPEKLGYKKNEGQVFQSQENTHWNTQLQICFSQEHFNAHAKIANTIGKIALTPVTLAADIIFVGPLVIIFGKVPHPPRFG